MEDALRALHSMMGQSAIERVLILIVMEDALRDSLKNTDMTNESVLILIVMEDALRVGLIPLKKSYSKRLNPYCNGRCS